jgi:hypothetical protein
MYYSQRAVYLRKAATQLHAALLQHTVNAALSLLAGNCAVQKHCPTVIWFCEPAHQCVRLGFEALACRIAQQTWFE